MTAILDGNPTMEELIKQCEESLPLIKEAVEQQKKEEEDVKR